jgi:hypothetical protein
MNANLKIRLTQLAGLLLLACWWMTSAQSASARPLPPGDVIGSGPTTTGSTTAPVPAATVVVHDHPSVWAYLLVAVVAVTVTLLTVWAVRTIRRASSGRQAKQLQPA